MDDVLPGFLLQIGFFRTCLRILYIRKKGVFFTDNPALTAFQIIQRLVAGDSADPCPFMFTIKTVQIFIGGKECILSQILGIKLIAGGLVADAVDQFFILLYQI